MYLYIFWLNMYMHNELASSHYCTAMRCPKVDSLNYTYTGWYGNIWDEKMGQHLLLLISSMPSAKQVLSFNCC